MSKRKLERLVTPVGTAMWSHLDEPRPAFDGKGDAKYEITIVFDPHDAIWAPFVSEIKERLTAMGGMHNPIKWETEKDNSDKKVRTGMLCVRFKTGAEFKPQCFDQFGRIMESAKLGNGSKVKVNYSPAEFPLASFGGGINLYLNAVQVMELVPYARSGDPAAYGFTSETPPPNEDFPPVVEEPETGGVAAVDADDIPF